MGETRVDLQHLLEDLRDAYTGSLEETILTEVVANALDSGATHIRILTDPAESTMTVVDNGRGMQRRELARYHDVAASTKSRGEGIGFAGVGIKLGLLVSREVLTETHRGATHVATRWHLATRHRAPWKWIAPPGWTGPRGTAVRLTLENQLSPLLDGGYLEAAIRHQFEPLLDVAFDDLLLRHYPQGIALEVDGHTLERATGSATATRIPISIRLGRRRTPSALGYLERHDTPLAEPQQGVAVSTFGKVIKRGWDWLGLTPVTASRVTGLIEAPDLATCLTLSKNDFIRSGTRGATYLAYRKAIQEVVSRQLAAWGDSRDADPPRIVRLERDLERVLEDLAEDFPLLRSLVDKRTGGQKRLPLPGRGDLPVATPLFADAPAAPPHDEENGARGEEPRESLPRPADPPNVIRPPDVEEELKTTTGRRRPIRYGLLVQFESRRDDAELARLVDSTIWINDAHPAYLRATASRSIGYHLALSVALTLAPLAADKTDEHGFITQFLARWGYQDRRQQTEDGKGRRQTRGR